MVVKGETRWDPDGPAEEVLMSEVRPSDSMEGASWLGPCWCSMRRCPQGCPAGIALSVC